MHASDVASIRSRPIRDIRAGSKLVKAVLILVVGSLEVQLERPQVVAHVLVLVVLFNISLVHELFVLVSKAVRMCLLLKFIEIVALQDPWGLQVADIAGTLLIWVDFEILGLNSGTKFNFHRNRVVDGINVWKT